MELINLYLKNKHDVVCVCRTEKSGTRFIKTITDHRPYMYIEDKEGKYKGLFGETLKKIVYESPIEVKLKRDKYPKTWESDIIYTNRVLIDKIDKITKTKIRILYFDIETALGMKKTDEDKETSNEENPLDPTTCISVLDNFSNKLVTFVWHIGIDEGRLKEKFGSRNIYCYVQEEDMINAFIKFVNVVDCDLLVGWNSNSFDLVYMMNRCKKLNVNFDKIGMEGRIKFKKYHTKKGTDETEWEINGRYAFDLLRAYRHLTDHELDSYKLNDIAKLELGESKIEIEESFEDLWNNDIEKLIEYNRKDVLLLKFLDTKPDLEIIDTFDERRIEYGCQWQDLWHTTKWQDIIFLRECKDKICLPRKQDYKEKKKEEVMMGGYVHEVKPGLHNNVIVLDLENLYPAIMISFNMSPETIDNKGVLNVGNEVRFRDDKIGIIPQVLMKYRNLRKIYEMERDKAKEEGNINKYKLFKKKRDNAKLMGNSLYGAMKQHFRLSTIKIAGSVTYIGQAINKYSSKVVEENKEEIIEKFNLTKCNHIYSDTDSCFIELGDGNLTRKQLIEIGDYIVNLLNKSYDDFAKQYGIKKHFFNIQLEDKKLFNVLFFGTTGISEKGAKKRYTGYLIEEDGKMDKDLVVVGFEIRRSDSAPVAKVIQTEIFKIVLGKGSRDDILGYVKKMKDDLVNGKYNNTIGEWTYDNFAIPKGVTKEIGDYKTKNPWVKGLVYAQKYLNFKFNQRKKVKLLYIKQMDSRYPPTKELCYESIKQLEGLKFVVDWKRQMPPLVDNKVERVLNALGMESGTSKLDGWF